MDGGTNLKELNYKQWPPLLYQPDFKSTKSINNWMTTIDESLLTNLEKYLGFAECLINGKPKINTKNHFRYILSWDFKS